MRFAPTMAPMTATVVATLVGCLFSEPSPPGDAGGSESTSDAADTTGTGEGSTTTTDVSSDGQGTGDLGPDGVACEEDLCSSPEVCCAAMDGSTCAETCSPGAVAMSCDGPEDCDGGVCCWGLTAGSSCAASVSDCDPLMSEVACHDREDCGGGECAPHEFVYWISLCE